MHKTVWHTDIVVDGRGIGLKVSPTLVKTLLSINGESDEVLVV